MRFLFLSNPKSGNFLLFIIDVFLFSIHSLHGASLPHGRQGNRVHASFFHIHNQHLQAVFQIGKAHIRIVVKRQDLGVRVHFPHFFYDAASYHMVWQTAKWL